MIWAKRFTPRAVKELKIERGLPFIYSLRWEKWKLKARLTLFFKVPDVKGVKGRSWGYLFLLPEV